MKLNINNNKKKEKIVNIEEPTIFQIIHEEIISNKTRMNIITFLINILSFYIYYLSLEGCIGTQIDCLKIMTIDKFIELFCLVLFSSFLFNITLIISFFKKNSIFCMIYLIILYNKKRKKLFFFFIFIFIILFIISISFLYIKSSCSKWNTGLNDVIVDNDNKKYSCKFITPRKCYINAFNNIFDISKIIKKNCNKEHWGINKKEKLYKYINENISNAKRIGFPITTNKDFWLRTQKNIEHFSERVLSRVVDMDNLPKNIIKPEVYIDFSDNDWKININIIKNETLIEERNNISKKINSSYNNILFIYLDSISRQHFKRKMPYLSNFIKQYLTKKENEQNAYQFLKYHNFAAFTQKNVQPMFYGEKMDPKSSNGTSIIKYMKERGYITGQSSNLCSKELFVTMNNCLNKVEFSDYDHENVAMFCDPNYYDRTNPYPAFSGPFSVLRRCLYKKDSYEYVLEYGKKFWEAYKEHKKFLRLSFIDAHESTGEVIKYLDKPIFNFINYLINNNMMHNSIIIFASDHGNGMPSIYNILNSDDYLYENVLGFLSFVLIDYNTEDMSDTLLNNLENNQQVFVTPYDIHDSLIDIIYNNENEKIKSRFGNSLFRYIEPKERNCLKYKELSPQLCRCINY